MSALGAAVAKAVGSVGGPQIATAVLVGGLVVGGVTGGIVIGGGGSSGQPAQSARSLSIYPCPDTGPEWARVGPGQKMYITGKTADGTWVRIYWPLPGTNAAFVKSASLKINGSLANVPVVTCPPIVAGPLAVAAPSATDTPTQDNSPTPPPTGEPTAAPNKAPKLASLTAAPTTIAGGPERYCKDTARSVTFKVNATDVDGIGSVSLFYRDPDASGYTKKAMARGAGDTWQVTLGTDTDSIGGKGSLRYYVSATDANAASKNARLPTSGSRSVTVDPCANTGPTLASFKASPAKVYTNAGTRASACPSNPTTTTISVKATDVDDVDGATLFYRLPGDGNYRKTTMTKSGSTWSAKVTPIDQRPNADGRTSWYVVAKDGTGKTTKSDVRTFVVDRCNYPALIKFTDYAPSPMCPSRPTSFYMNASDRDGLGGSSAVIVYTYLRTDGTTKTARKAMTLDDTGGQTYYYRVSLQPTATWSQQRDTMTFHFETTDKYGGVSKGGDGKITVTNC